MLLLLLACTGPKNPIDTADTGTEVDWLFDENFEDLEPSDWTWGTWTLGATQLDPNQAEVVDGELRMHLDLVKDTWHGVELAHVLPFTSGRFEARIAAPAEPGSVCALFLYGEDKEGEVHEIDVELLSAEPDTVRVGTYANWTLADGYEDGTARQSVAWQRDGFTTAELHDYAIVWTESAVTFEVDGQTIATVTRVPSEPITLRLNHWTSTTWPEVQGPPAGSSTCVVDRLRARDLLPEEVK